MSDAKLALEWIPGRYAVCRLEPRDPLPAWVAGRGPAPLLSVTRTDREISIVAGEWAVPSDQPAERGWSALRVAGTLDFALVGVISRLAAALAAAGVPLLVVSTYETDILLVRSADAPRAVEALRSVADVSRL